MNSRLVIKKRNGKPGYVYVYVYYTENGQHKTWAKSTGLPVDGFDKRRQRWRKLRAVNLRISAMQEAVHDATTIDEAKQIVADHIHRLKRIPVSIDEDKSDEQKTIREWFAEYYNTEIKTSDLTKSAKARYRRVLEDYSQAVSPIAAASVDLYTSPDTRETAARVDRADKHWNEFRRHLINKSYRPGTQAVKLGAIRTFLIWLERKRGIKMSFGVSIPKIDSRNIVIPMEVCKGLAKMEVEPNAKGYWIALCKIMLYGALRIGDALSLREKNIVEDGIEIVSQKTGTPERKYIPSYVLEEFSTVLRYRPKGITKNHARSLFVEVLRDAVRVIPGGDMEVFDYRTTADGKKERYGGPLWQVINPHDLRGASVNLILALGGTPADAMQQGGWKSEAIFRKHYLDRNAHIGKLRKVFDKL